MTTLSKTVRVLELEPFDADNFAFTQRADTEPGEVVTCLVVQRALWVELGRPATVTVIVEPGNTLNPIVSQDGHVDDEEDDFLTGSTCNPNAPEDCDACQ